MEDDVYGLTEAGIEKLERIDEMFRTTDYTLERIAWEVDMDPMSVRIMYAVGNLTGVVDALNSLEESDGL